LALDNCVARNKSQVVMMFMAMLSLVMYDHVILHFNVTGHTHFPPDRTYFHGKNACLKKQRDMNENDGKNESTNNLYHPQQFADEMNKVKNLSATFLDHNSEQRPMFDGWESLLLSVFNPIKIEGSYVANHVFEFSKGKVQMRPFGYSPDTEVVEHIFTKEPEGSKNTILMKLFGTLDVSELTIDKVKLPRLPNKQFSLKKTESLIKKIDLIPLQYQSYYPTMEELQLLREELEKSKPAGAKKKKGKIIDYQADGVFEICAKIEKSAISKKSKKSVTAVSTNNSILSYFKAVDNRSTYLKNYVTDQPSQKKSTQVLL